MEKLNETTGRRQGEDSLESLVVVTQREICLAVDMKNHEELSREDSVSIRDKARRLTGTTQCRLMAKCDSLRCFVPQFAIS